MAFKVPPGVDIFDFFGQFFYDFERIFFDSIEIYHILYDTY